MDDKLYIKELLELKKSEVQSRMLLDKVNKKISKIEITDETLEKPHLSSLLFHNMIALFFLFLDIYIIYSVIELIFGLGFHLLNVDSSLNYLNIFILVLSIIISFILCYPKYHEHTLHLKEENARKLKDYELQEKSLNKKKLLISKLDSLNKDSNDIKSKLKCLYEEKNIANKYRNLCDIVILNNYFESGRCGTLEEALNIYAKEGMFVHKEHINEDNLSLKLCEAYCIEHLPVYYNIILELRNNVDDIYKNELLKG